MLERTDVITPIALGKEKTRQIGALDADGVAIHVPKTYLPYFGTCVRRIDNPRRIVPAALNFGVAARRGEIIMRIDAHYEYPPHSVGRLVHWMNESGGDKPAE